MFKLFPFVRPFYAFEFLLFFIYHSTLKDLSIIISLVGTHQGDLLIGFLFTFIHFCAFVFQTLFPCVFSLL